MKEIVETEMHNEQNQVDWILETQVQIEAEKNDHDWICKKLRVHHHDQLVHNQSTVILMIEEKWMTDSDVPRQEMQNVK